jgi:hypothetical protein
MEFFCTRIFCSLCSPDKLHDIQKSLSSGMWHHVVCCTAKSIFLQNGGIYLREYMAQVVQRLEWLVAGLSVWKPTFDPGLVHVQSVMDQVENGQAFLQVLQFPLSVSFHQCSMLMITYDHWCHIIFTTEIITKQQDVTLQKTVSLSSFCENIKSHTLHCLQRCHLKHS